MEGGGGGGGASELVTCPYQLRFRHRISMHQQGIYTNELLYIID